MSGYVGALTGIVVQLTMLAVGLMVTLVVWTVRLTMMLVAAAISAVSSMRR